MTPREKFGGPVPQQLPAVSLVAVPGRRRLTLDIAREIERRGFAGIFSPSRFANFSLCESLPFVTERIVFGTAISPIYARSVDDFAQSAAFLHEVSGGRFRLGIGVAHAPSQARMGASPGRPLADTRAFVAKIRGYAGIGAQPPLILAALRTRMVALSGEIGQGVVFANASRSHMQASLAALPADKRTDEDFFIGNMLPTCICDDLAAARAVHRHTLTHYVNLPNYRNYWKEAGYVEEMTAIETALAENRPDDVPKYLTDAWVDDVTLSGPAARVRAGLEAWVAAGVRTPIIVPSSAAGNQLKAIEEMFATFA
jgi:alkanesulfonate monooxygenase SsuD/methylene tetrahydromethanopterin reductase-like flavin-dependent oxidoreductase (luciferase family)